ncbi:HK97-gp10 family putative phage morphogenesis protein [Antarcticirhabdus aurantiaca]|uniref:HK97 gp10 family phage protein n=1 Tax=Antarcticirhabdus aurantiaca TaxID=2606717 RepID=A0ACD4NW86_9HYPH|nr:HK97 gp10 family phage protein [Jeongeuplla avenae]
MADDGGLSKLQRRFAALPAGVVEAVRPALMDQARTIANTMEQLAPEDEGFLKASIAVTGPGRRTPAYSQPGGSMTVPENAVAVTVGDHDVRYAHLVEYGTQQAPAQPYFWPSVRLHRKKATNGIKSAIRRAVKKGTPA